jgi:hypothetical protein
MHALLVHKSIFPSWKTGSCSWAGLSGVSGRELSQQVKVILGRKIAYSLPAFSEVIAKSVWNSRSWTLQEMYFSRRLIYFTPVQVYFQCSQAIWREDRFLEVRGAAVEINSADYNVRPE